MFSSVAIANRTDGLAHDFQQEQARRRWGLLRVALALSLVVVRGLVPIPFVVDVALGAVGLSILVDVVVPWMRPLSWFYAGVFAFLLALQGNNADRSHFVDVTHLPSTSGSGSLSISRGLVGDDVSFYGSDVGNPLGWTQHEHFQRRGFFVSGRSAPHVLWSPDGAAALILVDGQQTFSWQPWCLGTSVPFALLDAASGRPVITHPSSPSERYRRVVERYGPFGGSPSWHRGIEGPDGTWRCSSATRTF